jgi:hypothetical protein
MAELTAEVRPYDKLAVASFAVSAGIAFISFLGLLQLILINFGGHAVNFPQDFAFTVFTIVLDASIPITIVGIILGHVASAKTKVNGKRGRKLAIAAFTIGYISAFGGILLIGFIFLIASAL